MANREVRAVDYREVVRRWLAGDGMRALARGTGLDRKTVRRIVHAAERLGLKRGNSLPADATVSALVRELRGIPAAASLGETEQSLLPYRDRIRRWLAEDKLLLTRVHDLPVREGLLVPYASLHRFARKFRDFGRPSSITEGTGVRSGKSKFEFSRPDTIFPAATATTFEQQHLVNGACK